MSKFKPIPLSNINAEFVSRTKKPFVFSNFIYNKENGAIMGRTGASWAKVVIFYTAFYGVLAALVALQFHLLFRTIDPSFPKRQLYDSLIGAYPGLSFRPLIPEDNLASTLIWYQSDEPESFKHLTASLDNFLEVYKIPGLTPGRGQNIYNCDYNQPPPPYAVCDVDVRGFGPCIQENNYGYLRSSPCIFLKLNKIYGWIPDFYNISSELPENMPHSLKHYILDMEQTRSDMLNTIWISCDGENPADKENIGPFNYYPRQGFPGFYYPYKNTEGYLSPLVAIRFERPQRRILINIVCKAWARNIYHDRNDRLGSVHFQLLID